tara:strand:- start:101 stop:757 length:657 start_codon:yes stop_codon:yes gene_type:complete
MDIISMHTEFKLLMDKADGGGSPSFLAREIDRFLNAAIERFVAKRAFGNNSRRTGFEEDQKRRDDLRNLISNHSTTDFTSSDISKPGGVFVALPKDYRHSINEECIVSKAKNRVGVKPLTYDRYNKITSDPFNVPDGNSVYRLDYSKDSFELISIVPIQRYFLRYLKNPAVVSFSGSTSCDLAGHTHREIVRMAVVEALENIEDPRYQSSKIELNDIE